MDLTKATNKVLLRGVTGSRVVPTITVDRLDHWGLAAAAREAANRHRCSSVAADGVLGTDGLQDKRIFIDFRHDRITIFACAARRAPAGYLHDLVKIVNAGR